VRWKKDFTTGKLTIERVHLITSLPPGAATGAQLAAWITGHWKIENLLHHVRDRTFREDDSTIHAGHLPHVMASLRNLAIGPHRQDGHSNIAAALRHTARDWRRPLTTLGIPGWIRTDRNHARDPGGQPTPASTKISLIPVKRSSLDLA
jgi:hypothetical protein